MSTDLIAVLVQRQRTLAATDAQFALLLGVERSYWTRVRHRELGVATLLLGGVLRAFPDLAPDVLAFLRVAHVAKETYNGK